MTFFWWKKEKRWLEVPIPGQARALRISCWHLKHSNPIHHRLWLTCSWCDADMAGVIEHEDGREKGKLNWMIGGPAVGSMSLYSRDFESLTVATAASLEGMGMEQFTALSEATIAVRWLLERCGEVD